MRCLLSVVSVALMISPVTAWPARTITDPQERNALLRDWAKGAKAARDFNCRVERTEFDTVYKTEKKILMGVCGTSPDVFRLSEWDTDGKPHTLMLLTRDQLRLFHYGNKTERTFTVKSPGGQLFLFDDFRERLSFYFFDLNVETVEKRYRIEKVQLDPNYLYLHLEPREKPKSWRLFSTSFWQAPLRIVLDRSTWRLRQVTDLNVGSLAITWDVQVWQENLTPPVTLESLAATLPIGWKKP